jgi:hypothetical protein
MPEYCVSFGDPKPDSLEYPFRLLRTGWYKAVVDHLGVTITGNRDGLLYLAEVLVRCAISGYEPGFHVHMSLDSSVKGPNIDCSPELTVYGAEQQ